MAASLFHNRYRRPTVLIMGLLLLSSSGRLSSAQGAEPAPARVIHVPVDQPTIQRAVDLARRGDVVLVSPGVYRESVKIRDKAITLASEFLNSQNRKDIERTVIDGGGADNVLDISVREGNECTVLGLTLRNADDGITCTGRMHLLHNRITGTADGIDYENGGGVCRANVFDNNRDDGIDLDGACGVVIERNAIRDNKDDGIEIRLHKYNGPTLEIVIRDNVITGNQEDGIQIIDYPDQSDRIIRIHRNLFVGNAMAGVGCMGDGNSRENYEGADIPERIELVNNTFANHVYGVTGGDNMIVLNNIFVQTAKTALLKVDGNSLAAFNLFWQNGTDFNQSHVDLKRTFTVDPLLDEAYRPRPKSPAIDAGAARFFLSGNAVLELPAESYSGSSPDLGAFEFIKNP